MIDLMYSEKLNNFIFVVPYDNDQRKYSFLTTPGTSKDKAVQNAFKFDYKKVRLTLNTELLMKELASNGYVEIETFDYNNLEEFLEKEFIEYLI